jgi:protein subunit release factor B
VTSKAGEEVSKNIEQNASKWSDLIKELVDKLTGKDMAVTYEFKNLEIDMPRASGPGGKEIGSAKWKINGKFVISTELMINLRQQNKNS